VKLTDAILKSYVVLRQEGHPPLEALEKLRARIEGMDAQDKGRIVAGVRYYEAHLKKRQQKAYAGKTQTVKAASNGSPPLICENCGTLNWNNQVQCRSCGTPLTVTRPPQHMMTRRLNSNGGSRNELFKADTTLILRMPEQKHVLELCPQDYDRPLIFGRFDQSGGIIPDIDLTDYGGSERGVSRLHMSLMYEARHHHLTVQDMGSANGVFINGQRLNPFETHVLRSGDRLELGNFLIQVVYAH